MILEYAKKCEKSMIISSVLTLILGLVLLVEPVGSIRVMTSVISLISIIIGILEFIQYIKIPRIEKMMSFSLVLGVFFIAVGIFLFLNASFLIKFITIIIGITILVKSVFKIQFALNLRGLSQKWKYNLILGLISTTIGVLLLLNPFHFSVIFLRIIGALLAISSVVEFIETYCILRSLKNTENIQNNLISGDVK